MSKQKDIFGPVNEPTIQVDPNKIETSVFFVTVNSNKSYRKLSEDERKQWRLTLSSIFDVSEDNNFERFITDLNTGEQIALDKLVDFDFEGQIEVGPVRGLYHMHGKVTIRHRTKIHLNFEKIREELSTSRVSPSPHLKIIAIKQDKTTDYIYKYNKKATK